jgi:hypothetical protein
MMRTAMKAIAPLLAVFLTISCGPPHAEWTEPDSVRPESSGGSASNGAGGAQPASTGSLALNDPLAPASGTSSTGAPPPARPLSTAEQEASGEPSVGTASAPAATHASASRRGARRRGH